MSYAFAISVHGPRDGYNSQFCGHFPSSGFLFPTPFTQMIIWLFTTQKLQPFLVEDKSLTVLPCRAFPNEVFSEDKPLNQNSYTHSKKLGRAIMCHITCDV